MKRLTLRIITGLAALGLVSPAWGSVSVSLEPTPQTINVGGSASLDLVVSGLGNLSAPSLGAFDFDLTYNAAILSATSLSFGSSLDLGTLGSNRSSNLATPGAIHLDEISLETSSDLNNAQPGTFRLATLTFTGLASGSSGIDFSLANLSDEQGQTIAGFSSANGSIQVRGGPAPVPDGGTSAMLLLLSLTGLAAVRKSLGQPAGFQPLG